MTDKLEFTLPAFRIHQREQDGTAIYFSKINAKQLSTRTDERFKIDYFKRLDSNQDLGYQRQLSKNAVEKIKDFVLKETKNPLLPTAILVNSREPLDFKDSGNGIGTITVKNILYIIDGQHRFEAWTQMMQDPALEEMYGDYEFPLIVLSGFEEYREIEQFYVINSKQKKIKTDLAQRHSLALAKHADTEGLIPSEKRWELSAVKIADILNEQIESVWKKKIILADDTADLRKTKFISQSSFVSSLKPLFFGTKPVFKIEKGVNNLDKWAKIVADYWSILKKYYPNAIQNTRDYSLMKTVGVFSFHLVLERILQETKDVSEAMKEVDIKIKKASENGYGENFWRVKQSESVKNQGKYAGAFSSAVGHKRIAMGIYLGQLF